MLIEVENQPVAKGWECVRCGTVNAPYIEKCTCVKVEDKEGQDKRQLLTE